MSGVRQIQALPTDDRAGVRVDHAAQGVREIIVQGTVVESLDRRQAGDKRKHACTVDIGNAVRL